VVKQIRHLLGVVFFVQIVYGGGVVSVPHTLFFDQKTEFGDSQRERKFALPFRANSPQNRFRGTSWVTVPSTPGGPVWAKKRGVLFDLAFAGNWQSYFPQVAHLRQLATRNRYSTNFPLNFNKEFSRQAGHWYLDTTRPPTAKNDVCPATRLIAFNSPKFRHTAAFAGQSALIPTWA